MKEEEIITRVLNGEQALFETLVTKYQNLAYSRAVSLLLNHEDARDVVQESFLAAYVSLGTLRDKSKFPQWLGGIVRRKAIYFLRKKTKKNDIFEGFPGNSPTTLPDDQHEETPEKKMAEDDKRNIILKEVSEMDQKYREVIYMRYFEEFSYREIGDFLGITKSGVDSRLQRARENLEKRLRSKGLER